MRLICPNCSAQYEVPDDVMPPDGREVQCSNCGQTWFQDHPDTIAEREAAHSQDTQEVEVSADPPAETEGPDAEEPVEDNQPDDEVPAFVVEAQETEAAEDTGRRQLDPDVADVLREEAERETLARQQEADVIESQPDLGLPDVSEDEEKRKREAQDRMARMRGEEPDADGAGPRRDLLPDIEEINSTLRSNNSRSPDEDAGQTAQIEVQEKRSSRRGFTLTVALVAVMALVYTYAGQIAASFPAAEPALAGYVSMIDGWRLWMDEKVSSLLTWLDAAAVSSSSQ